MNRPEDTDALIAMLAGEVRPVPRHALVRRVLAGWGLGAVVTLGLIGAGLGFRPDLWLAMHGAAFWTKWLYTGALAVLALVGTLRLARPDAVLPRWRWLLVPVVVLAAVALGQLALAPRAAWPAMALGASWKVCSLLVFTLSLPIFGGLLWSYRRMAPTRLRLAGATAGLTAGAWSATLYCLHCPEVSALFVLCWYTLGMLGPAALGAFLGPRLLRW